MKKNIGSNFDDFLKEENLFDDAEAIAIKRVLAYQVQEELKKKHITKQAMADQMHTSRSSLDRLLDPTNTSITLKTLVKIAHVLDRKIKFSFATR
jgi:predicted XRE-type DNA-binding protein